MPSVAALDRVIEHSSHAGAAGLRDNALLMLTGPLGFGPFTTEEVRGRLALIRSSDSLMGRYSDRMTEAHLAGRRGQYEEAIGLAGAAADLAANLGLSLLDTLARWNAATMLRSAGRLDEAAAAYRRAIDRLEELGQASFRSTVILDLGRVVYEQGDPDAAERLAAEGEALGAAEDVINHAYGQSLRARIAADRGDTATAEPLALEALEAAYRTDFPSVHADVHETLAQVLAAAGRRDEALAEWTQALELWERYDYTNEANRVRALVTA